MISDRVDRAQEISFTLPNTNTVPLSVSSIMEDDFQIFSSLRYDPVLLEVPARNISHAGWNRAHTSPLYMLDYHRDRMLKAASHWGWDAAIEVLAGDSGLKRLAESIMDHIDDKSVPHKVRVAITKDGELSITSGPVPPTTLANLFPAKLPPPDEVPDSDSGEYVPSTANGYQVLVDGPQTARSEHTHFKTTKRAHYDGARQRAQISLPDKKEVLIVNAADGNVMEGSVTTPYFWRDGRWVTPAVSREYSPNEGSGGQNGTSRRWALEQ
jgi:4-amino-4-deoxychorismate lyase